MIEPSGPARLVTNFGQPSLLVNQRARLECGCSVWIGLRIDKHESVTLAVPCRDGHRWLMGRFNDLFRWSLEDGGTDRPLIDVVDELLTEAASEMVA